jgi:WD40 repeat protein
MAKLRLLIKRPGKANTCIPVMVDDTDSIGNCISSLVNHLSLPRRDGFGEVLTYTLRPFTDDQPLSNMLRFADAHLLPETRLMLELDVANAVTWPVGTVSGSRSAHVNEEVPPITPVRPIVSRRTFVVTSVLVGCATSGFFTGITTAFATRRHVLPIAMTPSVTQPPHVPGTLQQTFLFSGHQQTVRAVNWAPDGTMLASGADDGLLLLWAPDGQIRQQISHPAGVTALAWSPAGQRLASGSGKSVRFFDGRTATPLSPARNVHTGQVTSLVWSKAAGHPLVSGSLDKQAIVWETRNYQPQAVFTRHTTAIDALSYQSGSTAIASVSQGGVVRVWQVDTFAELHGFYQDAQLPMRAVAFAPMGNQLAVGGDDGQVRMWSNGLVCQQSVATPQGTLCADVPLRFRAHTAPVRSISWSPDGHFLATGGDDGVFAIWAFPPGKIPTVITKTTFVDPVVTVAWSPVRRQIAVASGKNVTIWNAEM